jgi:hypothetical protein
MANQTTVRDRPDGRGVVIEAKVDTPYAAYVRDGTAAHPIVAVNAKALRFNWKGETVFFKRVHHPGTSPDPWWDNALREMPAVIRRNWDAVNV